MKGKTLDNLINWIIIGLAFLLPLFFLPLTTEFYIFNKQSLLIFTTGLLLLLWLAKMVVSQTIVFRRTVLDLPLLLFLAAFILASLVTAPNKVTAFTAPTGAGTILALTALYFVITNNLKLDASRYPLSAFITSVIFLALIAIYQFLGLGEFLTTIPWLRNKLFTPAGGPLILITLLIVGLALAITIFIREVQKKNWLVSLLAGGASALIAGGLILTLNQILPGKETSLAILSYQDSWVIAIEAFKQSPFLGVGPGNYLSAFNRFRPVTFNNNAFWDVRFSNASSYPLELLTTGGIFVLATYLFLFFRALLLWWKSYQQEKETQLPLLIGLALTILLPWFIAHNFLLLSFSFIFLAILASLTGREQLVSLPSKKTAWIILGVGWVLVMPSFYVWERVYAADVTFRNSLTALEKNQGVQVYNLQIRTISLNPYEPRYRRAYSQTNFALANSLAGQAELPTDEAGLSDQDRANITQLIQQAIREAKAATVLNSTDAANWENLAQIYRNLINFAQGADQWAIAAYRQAIITDPINPRLRLNLGGLFYALQNYEEAIRQFRNAVDLKPDYANGYYNLAVAYREQGKYQLAYNALQVVLNLVPTDSPDYQKAKNEADELAKRLPPSEEVPPEAEETPVLTEPSPLPSPMIKLPIELPEKASPTPEGTPIP